MSSGADLSGVPVRAAGGPGPVAAPFAALDYAAQVEIIKEMARSALVDFGLAGESLTLLMHTLNSTFRIDVHARAGEEARAAERYVLRVYRPDLYSEAAVRSEVEFLLALRRDEGLEVPEPVPTRNGDLVAFTPATDGFGQRCCALFRWVEGRFRDSDLDEEAVGRVGEFAARLHRFGETFLRAEGFVRPRYDLDGLLGGEDVIPGPAPEFISRRDREILRDAARLIRAEAAQLGCGPDVFGLVHGDLTQKNYLFHQGEVRAIDFADFGWGYYLYDIATALLRLADRRDFPALERALLAGYRRRRPLPPEHERHLEVFKAARVLYLLRFLLKHLDVPRVRDQAQDGFPYMIGQIRGFLGRRLGEASAAASGARTLTTVQFLAQLHRLDIEVWIEGDRLRFSAPPGALTPQLRQELAERKPEILQFLRQTVSGSASGAPPIRPRPRTGNLPLSFAQERLWFFDQYEPMSPVYNISQAVHLRGVLRIDLLARSLGEILRRHETLRTAFFAVGGRPALRIAPASRVAIPIVDLRAAPEPERLARSLVTQGARQPFDLGRAPLLRTLLLRLGEDEHIFLFTIHHIVSDGWSSGIFIRELLTLYEAYSRGRPSPLPDLPIQYADFAAWQREWLAGEVLERQLAYWKRQLGGAPQVLALPTDRPRPAHPTYEAGKRTLHLSRSLSQRLGGLSHREGVTLYMALLAPFMALLHRYTGQEDLSVGSPIAGRNRAEIEGLIGFFVNTLVLRSHPSGELTLRELLEEVRQATVAAYAHQDLPFERLVEELQPERATSHTPFFQVVFALQNVPLPSLEREDLTVRTIPTESGKVAFDLLVTLREEEDGLFLSLRYKKDLFDAPTIRRLAAHFEALLEGAAADPSTRLSDLPLLSAAEVHHLRSEWNDTWSGYPRHLCIQQLYEAWAERMPDAPAVLFGEETWTYRQVNERANRLARYLRSLGVRPGVGVSLSLERSPELLVSLLAILKAGGAYVPLDPQYPDERIAFMLEDTRVAIALVESGTRQRMVRLAAGPLSGLRLVDVDEDREEIARQNAGSPPCLGSSGDTAYIMYTSGSTGRPKGVSVPHSAIVRLVRGTSYADFSPEQVFLLLAPVSFDASTFEIWGSLLNGARLVVQPPGTPSLEELGGTLRRYGVTTLWLTAGLFHLMVDERLADLALLKQLLAGGDALSVPHVRRLLEERAVPRLINGYGPTENTTFSCCHPLREPGDLGASLPIGRPIANTRAHVLDRHLQLVPIGVFGELCVGGDGLATGYLNRSDLTAERFIPDPVGREPGARLYRTGDLVRHLADGSIEFLGRFDHQVKIRGYRVELGEIEEVLRRCPGVRDGVVVVREGVPGGKRLIAYIVLETGAPGGARGLREFLERTLPEYMVPAAVVFLDALPLTPNGKVDRGALPAPGRDEAGSEEELAAPRDPIEDLLAGIWAEVLGRERVGVNDDFFDLGGHSLLATQVVSRVRGVFQVDLPLQTLFESPTVAGLAAAVSAAREKERGLEVPPIVPVPRHGELPLSFAQQRLWFLDQLEPASPAYNIPGAVRLSGALQQAVLEGAFRGLVRRHESLRTAFTAQGGRPSQVISPEAPVELPIADLAWLPAASREREARRLAAVEALRPFDLVTGPLVRFTLLRLGAAEHILLVTMHHIISDGWSTGIFLRELTALYGALLRGEPSPLPDLPVQYADFASWQRRWLEGPVIEADVGYWKRQLTGAPAVLELPADRPRPPIQTLHGAVWTIALCRELSAGLAQLSRREGATLYMTLLAAFQTLLFRLTGSSDVVVGSPIAGRNRREIEGLIGFFVNTLVLRTDLAGDPSFRHLLAGVRRTCLEAYAHQDVPFERLVEDLAPERDLSRSPLFQVMFALQNAPRGDLRATGLTFTALAGERRTAKFELTLSLQEGAAGINGSLEYNTDLFDRATAARLTGQLERLLADVVTDPGQRLSALRWLTEAERHQLRCEWNDTCGAQHDAACIHELFEAQVERTPEATAVVCGAERLSYSEVNRRANRLAHHLRALGVGRESRVGICVRRDLDLVVALLGTLKSGGAYVPLDPAYPPERLSFMLADSGAEVLLTQENLLSRLPGLSARTVCLDSAGPEIARRSAANPKRWSVPGSLAYLIYTSGSTGRPKGVGIEHRSAVALIRWARAIFTLEDLAGVLASTSICFDLSIFELFLPLAWGGRVIVVRDALELASTAPGDEVRLINTVPSAMTELVRLGAVPPSVRTVNLAGEPLQAALVERIRRGGTVRRVFNLYGPSEDTTYSTFAQIDPATGPPSIGRPLTGTQAHVLDREMRTVGIGVVGELYLGGEGLARGYVGRPETTASSFVPDPFCNEPGARLYRTGDLVRTRPDGTLHFLGRLDHQVKVRGFRIELGEIEAALLRCPGVKEVVVLAREDVPGDRRLVAYVVADPEPAVAGLRESLRSTLPEPMIPTAFVLLAALPLTPNGKVDRRALPAPEMARGSGSPMLPADPVEDLLAGIWAEVLGRGRVGVEDNFFELGGHSLLATQIVSRVRETFGVNLPLHRFFEGPRVSDLARRVREAQHAERGVEAPPIVPVPRDGDLPLSFAQQRLWFLDRFEPGSSAYHIPSAVRLTRTLEPRWLEQALGEVVRRHESLRTTFAMNAGHPVQVIAASAVARLPVVDLAALPAGAREPEARHLAASEARRVFDLERGPLLRTTLLRLEPGDHLLLLTLHHIVSDGWSMGILVRELTALYAAFSQREASPLPPLPVQYADFAHWQRRWLAGEVLEAELAYWRDQLAGVPPSLELPTDRPRPALQTFRGRSQPLLLEKSLAEPLASLGRRHGATAFMTLLAVFKVLLSRCTGQSDLVVGSPIAGRNRKEIEPLIGFFVNTLALRSQVDGARGFDELLARVRRTALDAYAHQDIPFERLVEELAPERDLSRSPIFQVMFVLQNVPRRQGAPDGPRPDSWKVDNRTAKFDLTLTLAEDGPALSGALEYNTDLFDGTTALRLMEHFRRLLLEVAVRPEQPLRELSPLAEAERHQLLLEWNDTAVLKPDEARCLHELVERQVERTPEAVALVWGEEEWTYRRLDLQANRLAHRLRALGVGPEVPVGLCARRSPDLVAGILGILKAGGAYVPLDPEYPPERLGFMLADVCAPVLLTQAGLLPKLPPHQAHVVLLDGPTSSGAAAGGRAPASGAGPENLAYFIYTSGSTGRPKGVAIEHRSACGLVRWAHGVFSATECAGVLVATSICFDLSVFELFVPLTRGGRIILAESALALSDLPAARQVTLVNTVPSAMAELVRLGGVPASVTTVNLAGEPLPGRLVEALYRQQTIERVFNLYGPSEDTTYSTFARMERGGRRPPAIGRPIAGTRVYLLDPDLEPVPVGVQGEIYIGGLGLARSYFGRPELTAERFVPDPFATGPGRRLYQTGDLGRFAPEGQIDYLGRSDLQVKVRGFRIELGEVERALVRHPAVCEAVVLADQEGSGGGRLVAFFVAEEHQEAEDAELRRFLAASLPAYMVPAVCLRLARFPLTPNGKVDRRALAKLEMRTGETERACEAPRDRIELELQRIWEEVLATKPIGVTENFFRLGGHSLLAAHLVARLREQFQREIPIALLFRTPTIESLAAVLRDEDFASPGFPSLVPLQPRGAKRPFFCVHGALGSAFHLMELARALGGADDGRPVYGLQAKGLVGDGEPLASVPEMADWYLAAIRSAQPSGPYLLGGYSMGGLVAYEMARRLRAQGEAVAALVMIDTLADAGERIESFTRSDALVYLAGELGIPLGESDLRERTDDEQLRCFLDRGQAARMLPPGMTARELQRHLRTLESNLEAARRFRACEPHAGKVTVFRAQEQSEEDPALGWGRIAQQGVEVGVVPGSHRTMIRTPQAEILAARLRECLERAEPRC